MRLHSLLVRAAKAIPDGEVLAVIEVKLGMVNSMVSSRVDNPRVGGEVDLIVDVDGPHVDANEHDDEEDVVGRNEVDEDVVRNSL